MSNSPTSFKDLRDFASSDAFEAKLKWVQQHWDDTPAKGQTQPQHRAELLRELANASLRDQGIPQLKGTYLITGQQDSSYHFSFSPTATQPQNDWTLGIDARLLSMDAKQIVREVEFGREGFGRIGGLVYHEIRHAQQFYWMAVERGRNTNSPLPPNVPANTKRLPPEVEAGVPSFIMAEARADTRQFTPTQQQLVQNLYAQNSPYQESSPGKDKPGISPRERTQRISAAGGAGYYNLERERDAYDAHRFIRQSQDMTEFYNEKTGVPKNRELPDLERPKSQQKSEVPSPSFISESYGDPNAPIPGINGEQRAVHPDAITPSTDDRYRTTLRDYRVVHEELSGALEESIAALNQIPATVAPIQSRDFKLVRLSGPEPRGLESESGSFERVLAERWQNSIQSSLQRQAEQQQQGDDSGLELGGLGD
jgi:hypothetical protein